MANFLSPNGNGRGRSASNDSDRPTKRISTPAGMRLSVIMENTFEQKSRPRYFGTHLKSGSISKGSTLVGDPRESSEGRSSGPMGYSYDISSEKLDELPPPTLTRKIKASNFVQRKGGWKRLLLIALVLLLCIIAIVVGTTVGLSQQKKDNNDDSRSQSSNSGSGAVVGAAGASPTTGVGSSPTSTNVPNGFPLGSYSFTIFLDTVTTDCTPDANTWTCFPYTIYNDDHAKSLTTFNWIISEKSQGNYQISSVQNPFAINFENTAMKMVDKDGDNERYQFQISMDKQVVPSASITDDGSQATCFYNATTMTGYLYTKRAKNYPTSQDTATNATYQAWPYAVRVEQTAGGGEGVPDCYKTTNGNLGERVGNQTATDPTTLCSCLYRNFLTPGT